MRKQSSQPDQDHQPKKPGFFRRRARSMGHLVNPSMGMDAEGNTVRSADVFPMFGHLFTVIRQGLGVFRDQVLAKPKDEPAIDYAQVAQSWGITKDRRPRILRNLRIEQMLFVALTLFGIAHVLAGLLGYAPVAGWVGAMSLFVIGGMSILFGITMAAIAGWRLDVIRERRYRSFGRWLRGG